MVKVAVMSCDFLTSPHKPLQRSYEGRKNKSHLWKSRHIQHEHDLAIN